MRRRRSPSRTETAARPTRPGWWRSPRGPNTITVTVTAEDGVTTLAYTVTVTRAVPSLSDDATLSGLSLTGVEIGTFASGTTAYTADVDHDVETTTVTATATHAGGTVSIAAGDGNTAGGSRTWRSPRGRPEHGDGDRRGRHCDPDLHGDGDAGGAPVVGRRDAERLSLSGVNIGTFASGTTAYTADVDHGRGDHHGDGDGGARWRDGVDRRRDGNTAGVADGGARRGGEPDHGDGDRRGRRSDPDLHGDGDAGRGCHSADGGVSQRSLFACGVGDVHLRTALQRGDRHQSEDAPGSCGGGERLRDERASDRRPVRPVGDRGPAGHDRGRDAGGSARVWRAGRRGRSATARPRRRRYRTGWRRRWRVRHRTPRFRSRRGRVR